MSGAVGTLIDIFRFLEVESIGSMFDLDPNRPIWFVKKSGNIAVWPWGGQFSGPLVVPTAVYDVKGHPPSTAEVAATVSAGSGQLDTTSPFGAYTSPVYSKRSPVLAQFPHPPMKRKKGWNKTIIVVSLKKEKWQGKH